MLLNLPPMRVSMPIPCPATIRAARGPCHLTCCVGMEGTDDERTSLIHGRRPHFIP